MKTRELSVGGGVGNAKSSIGVWDSPIGGGTKCIDTGWGDGISEEGVMGIEHDKGGFIDV